ncbi:hypothetical protein [Sporolactobacillus terrae]|uniref:Uncharacterized protein n=1 Tax=Sporolactobacillus terrae TaxID=269673 RepID=A0A5K7X500_9BACL|nr:hypothetical protein [Sporolactobacillus terrae]BBO00029.1 hypothetical protein St703_27330 [Sporolactobacillus terrae]
MVKVNTLYFDICIACIYALPSTANAESTNELQTKEEVESLVPTLKVIDQISKHLLQFGDSETINEYFSSKGIASQSEEPKC